MTYNTNCPIRQSPAQVQTVHNATTLARKGAKVLRLREGSKLPSAKGGFKTATSDLALIANLFQPDENVGAATGHEYGGGLVVLDIDVPKDGGGIPLAQTVTSKRLIRFFGTLIGDKMAVEIINDALWIRTSSGGTQLWLRGEQGARLLCRDHIDLGTFDPRGKLGPASDRTSFDTRGENGYAVAPGSATRMLVEQREDGSAKVKQAEGTYQAFWRGQIVQNLDDLPEINELPILPAGVINEINALPLEGKDGASLQTQNPISPIPTSPVLGSPPSYATQKPYTGGSMGFSHRAPKDPRRVRDALSHSVSHAPLRYASRTGWFDAMSALAGAAEAGELSEEEAAAIYEWFCTNTPGSKIDNADQWEKTKELARDRLRKGELVRGCKAITDQATADGWADPATDPIDAQNELWPGDAKATKGGPVPYDNALNAAAILTREGFKFRFITRGHFHEVLAPQPHVSPAFPAGWQPLGDTAVRQLTSAVNARGLPTAKPSTVAQAAKTLGDKVPYDPFKEMLEKLPTWDGVARIEDTPSRYLGADTVPVTAAYFKHFLMQLMARTHSPGCKADEMLVLIGCQRSGKSTVLRKLVGDEFFTDAVTLKDTAKEVIEKTQRTVLIEVSEMIGITGSGAEKCKATISRQEDRARLAYVAETTQVKRSFVWAGTSNDPELFNDPTGSLRFMPITVGTIDTAAIDRDREQILAEALHKFRIDFGGDARRVKLDPKWWDAAKAETEKYEVTNPWEDTVSAILVDERHKLRVWTDEQSRHGYILSAGELLGRLLPHGYNKTGSQAKRLSEGMLKLGFAKTRTMIDRKRETRYFRPFTQEELAWRAAQVQAGQPVDNGQGIGLAPGLVAVS